MKTTVLSPFPKSLNDSRVGLVAGGELAVRAEATIQALLRDEKEVQDSDDISERKGQRKEGGHLAELKEETKLLGDEDSFKQIKENVLCAAFPY